MKNLSQTEWENLYEELDNSTILDVRTEQEYLDGKIPNSLNIDILNPQEFMSKVALLTKSSKYFVGKIYPIKYAAIKCLQQVLLDTSSLINRCP